MRDAPARCLVFSTVAGYCDEPATHRFAGTPMCAQHDALFRDPEGNPMATHVRYAPGAQGTGRVGRVSEPIYVRHRTPPEILRYHAQKLIEIGAKVNEFELFELKNEIEAVSFSLNMLAEELDEAGEAV